MLKEYYIDYCILIIMLLNNQNEWREKREKRGKSDGELYKKTNDDDEQKIHLMKSTYHINGKRGQL